MFFVHRAISPVVPVGSAFPQRAVPAASFAAADDEMTDGRRSSAEPIKIGFYGPQPIHGLIWISNIRFGMSGQHIPVVAGRSGETLRLLFAPQNRQPMTVAPHHRSRLAGL